MLKGALGWYRDASLRHPLTVAFATCLVKGSASDWVAQKWVEGKDTVSLRRNVAFALFSAAYLGCGQHVVYNVVFTRLFGAGRDLRTMLKKVAADGLVHTPMVYFPLYYMYESTCLGGSPRVGLAKYQNEWLPTCKMYWTMWTPVHVANFTVVPPELRIAFVASVSFVWLTILSFTSHKSLDEVSQPTTQWTARVLASDREGANPDERSR